MNEAVGRSAVLQNIRALMEFLNRYSPFSQMEQNHLAYLIEHSSLVFFADGETVLSPDEGVVGHFYIVKQGHIRGERATKGHEAPETTFEIAPGECFPLAALLGERATRTAHMADGDTFLIRVPKEHFVKVFSISNSFRDFCVRGVSSLLDLVNQHVQTHAVQNLGNQFSLDTPLYEIAARNPIVCTPDTPIRKAVSLMHGASVSSIVITDDTRQARGIFTLRDLRRLVAENNVDLDSPVAQAMSADPYSLPSDATAFDAALMMADHHITHLVVTSDEGQLAAVLSERDLFSLQRVDLVHLVRTIKQAPNLNALISIRADITRLIETMLAHGAASPQLNRIITMLNDHTVCRVIDLTLKELGDPGIPFTWIAFGSEGRMEQTLVTDQDNGILFRVPEGETPDTIREKLLPLAKTINQKLNECGFEWCKGNIMASNPNLCRSEREWENWFNEFISKNTPENLLNSAIFMDIRPVWGDPVPVERMFGKVVANIQKNTLFQKMMAMGALQSRPPLNMFKGFVYAKGGEKHTIDLKVQGMTPFVEAARIFALANGIKEQSTLGRIRGLVAAGKINEKDARAFEEAYSLIQLLRMKNHQEQSRTGKELSNRIDPSDMNELDRRILRESFRQAQRFQKKLELAYQV